MARPKRTNSRIKKDTDKLIRLNKYLALCGVCSRRKADDHIEEGLVRVNSQTITELGFKIDPQSDQVYFKGKKIKAIQDFTYIALYKPRSVLTSLSDPYERPTIIDILPKKLQKKNLFPVGRLDWQSEGLLILTNDGDYAQNILHPKKNVAKTYEVKIEGPILDKDLQKLVSGVTIPGGKARSIKVDVIKKSKASSHTWLRLSVVEGRNRLIRKMLEKLGYSVMRLRRVAIGNLKVSYLKAGEWAELSESKKNLVFETPSSLKDLL